MDITTTPVPGSFFKMLILLAVAIVLGGAQRSKGSPDSSTADTFCLFGCHVNVAPDGDTSCSPGGEWKCIPALKAILSVPI